MSIQKRIKNLEHAQGAQNGLAIVWPGDDEETIRVVIHDDRAGPPTEKIFTRAEYEQWKREQTGDYITIVVKYEDEPSV